MLGELIEMAQRIGDGREQLGVGAPGVIDVKEVVAAELFPHFGHGLQGAVIALDHCLEGSEPFRQIGGGAVLPADYPLEPL